jgi:hypothetical protein
VTVKVRRSPASRRAVHAAAHISRASIVPGTGSAGRD